MPFKPQPQYQCTAELSVKAYKEDDQCTSRAEYAYGSKRLCWAHMKRATANDWGECVSLKAVLGVTVHKL